MSVIEDKVKAMGYALPEPFKFPKPNRTGCVVVGSIIFASGHGRNMSGPNVKAKGKLGRTSPSRKATPPPAPLRSPFLQA